MNIELLRARLRELLGEMRTLVSDYETRDEDFSDEDKTRFDGWQAESDSIRAQIQVYEARAAAIEAANTAVETGASSHFGINTRGDAYDMSTLRLDVTPNELRSRAAEAIERDPFLPDAAKEGATATLRKVDRRGEVALLMLATGNPAYRSAFPKLVTGNHWAMDDKERQAVMRAQSLSSASGGYAIPFTLDPTVLLTNNGALNPIRQIARVQTITTDDWNGVTSAGATAHWRSEAAQADDDTITLTQPTISVYKMDLFVPYSIEIEMDWPQMESDLRMVMDDARQRLEATAHISGTGSGQPYGIVTALTGTSSEIAPTTAEVFALADVYKVRRTLPVRYRPSSDVPSWIANLSTYDAIRQFDTGGGGGFWTDMNDGTPDRLLSFRTYETSAMDEASAINPAVSGNNRILVCGDFSRYMIVDRIGMRVEVIPHLFGTANNRPTGQRGLYAILRTGADSIDDNAFRMLNVTTS